MSEEEAALSVLVDRSANILVEAKVLMQLSEPAEAMEVVLTDLIQPPHVMDQLTREAGTLETNVVTSEGFPECQEWGKALSLTSTLHSPPHMVLPSSRLPPRLSDDPPQFTPVPKAKCSNKTKAE